MTNKLWTQEEIDLLKEHYLSKERIELEKLFFNTKWVSIKLAARK